MQKKAYGSRTRLNKHHNFASGTCPEYCALSLHLGKVSSKTKPSSFIVSVTIATSAGHSTDHDNVDMNLNYPWHIRI